MASCSPMMMSLSFIQNALSSPWRQQFPLRPSQLVVSQQSKPLNLRFHVMARTRREDRTARHDRVRKKVEGTPERPRLSVFRSNKHMYAQVIDDTNMHTLVAASTMEKSISLEFDCTSGPTIEVAKKIGEVVAKKCLEKGITKVVFDRGGYPYHGRVEALAVAARENGLGF
ncbi:60S ribosomal protein L18 [Dionaea muscipula]